MAERLGGGEQDIGPTGDGSQLKPLRRADDGRLGAGDRNPGLVDEHGETLGT